MLYIELKRTLKTIDQTIELLSDIRDEHYLEGMKYARAIVARSLCFIPRMEQVETEPDPMCWVDPETYQDEED